MIFYHSICKSALHIQQKQNTSKGGGNLLRKLRDVSKAHLSALHTSGDTTLLCHQRKDRTCDLVVCVGDSEQAIFLISRVEKIRMQVQPSFLLGLVRIDVSGDTSIQDMVITVLRIAGIRHVARIVCVAGVTLLSRLL